MTMTEDERSAIVSYRLQKALDTFNEAKGIASLGFWNAVANRLYYACYYISSALLIKHSLSAQTHRGVITLIGLHFIKKGLISEESGKLYARLFEVRQTGDYDDLFYLTEDDVLPLIAAANKYIDELTIIIQR